MHLVKFAHGFYEVPNQLIYNQNGYAHRCSRLAVETLIPIGSEIRYQESEHLNIGVIDLAPEF